MPGLIEQVALGLAPWYIKWPVKLFLGGKRLVGALLGWIGRHPWPAAVIALCAFSGWLWWHDSRVIADRDKAIHVAVQTIEQMKAASEKNRLAQIAQKEREEQRYKDLAHEADKEHAEQLADANDALARYIATHRVRPAAYGSGFSPASPIPEGGDTGLPENATAETGLVAVSEANLHVCTADYVYAKAAYDWASGLAGSQ